MFKREERYIVTKIKTGKCVECVVVESDWPEYETVWTMIQDRVEGRPNELEQLRAACKENNRRWHDAEAEASRLRAEVAALKEELSRWKGGGKTGQIAQWRKDSEELAALKAPVGMEPVARTVSEVTNTGYVYIKLLVNTIPCQTDLYSAAQFAQVQRERDEYKEAVEDLRAQWKVDADRIISLLAERDAYKKDAERYRYFKSRFAFQGQKHALTRSLGVRLDEFDPDLDTAIDAAMQKEEEL